MRTTETLKGDTYMRGDTHKRDIHNTFDLYTRDLENTFYLYTRDLQNPFYFQPRNLGKRRTYAHTNAETWLYLYYRGYIKTIHKRDTHPHIFARTYVHQQKKHTHTHTHTQTRTQRLHQNDSQERHTYAHIRTHICIPKWLTRETHTRTYSHTHMYETQDSYNPH